MKQVLVLLSAHSRIYAFGNLVILADVSYVVLANIYIND